MTFPKLVLFAPAPFGLCSIAGPDAERYLHGRVTQDIKKIACGGGARSLVLTPQGRIQGPFSIFKLSAEKFLAASDPLPDREAAGDFLQALLQFKVADRLEGTRIEESHSRIFLLGSSAHEFIAADPGSGPDRLSFRRDFGTVPAFEIVAPIPNGIRAAVTAAGGSEIDHAEFERLTVIAGVPFFRRDITEKTLVPEIDVTAMVSFNKGCYAGQEVVEMAAARGRANRKLCRLKSAGAPVVTAGTEIFSAAEQSKLIGAVTSAAFDPETDSTYALGFCKAADGLEPEYLISGAKFTVLN